MIIITESNVFNTDADTIVNAINCVGFMGKGLALEFSLRYPKLLVDYKEKCSKKEINIGKLYYYKEDNILIINFPTKKDYKFPSKLEWIEKGLLEFINTYKKYNIKKVAFPLLGCKNGGLNSNQVIDLIKKHLNNLDIDIYICLDKKNPEGKEFEMLNMFKNCKIDTLASQVKLTNNQKENLRNNQKNITRFFQISKIDGIGFKTYKNIYDIFYNNKYNNIEQESLF